MRIIKYPLFYVIGITIYLILKFKWRFVLTYLFSKPQAKKIYPEPTSNVYKNDEKALVSIVQGDNIYAMLRAGLELLGGLERLDIKGKSVLIKPNIVNRYPSPSNTNPQCGVSKIFVGDMSAIFALPTKINAMKSGIWEAINDENMTFIPFEEYDWVEVDIPHGRFIKKAIVSEFIYNVLNNVN